MRVVYIAHPVKGDTAANIARAKRWLLWAAQHRDVSPVAPWIAAVEAVGGDASGEERELWLARDCAVVERCDELWLCGSHVSDGMRRELGAAMAAGVFVRDMTTPDGEPKEHT